MLSSHCATCRQVKLRESGSDSIEVADNGSGVAPEDYEALTLKYHTSKLSQFSDLEGLESYGFRGEALSSLCSVAEVSVVTRTADQDAATRLEFDPMGRILSRSVVPRAVGTTVAVKNIFSRHRELKANLRRELARVTSVVQAYGLGSAETKANMQAVFGARLASGLQPFEAEGRGSDDQGGDGRAWSIRGFVSKAGAGGRSHGDRQFFSLNGRPVDLPRFVRALNEVYRSLGSPATADARPAAVLDLRLPPDAYDINLAPDKRQVALHDEPALLQGFQEALRAHYEPSRFTFTPNGAAKPGLDGGVRLESSAQRAKRAKLSQEDGGGSQGDALKEEDDEEEEEAGRGA
ncbi:hypothetical protein QBZ16_000043 [Prototheca wickerhamii]|uniref:DNA mismatch repair protein S5 domain-containing protein n=1 Tax=Prototheca wickerhamii TaxID=3111 RepID=A0AAD9MLT3_PROWI|nr:hypothetical protein QBZ16_000043 [Prototheca wickerhamii]